MSFVVPGLTIQDTIQGSGTTDRKSVNVATTTAQVLATDFQNLSVIDSVTIFTNDRILIKNQTNPVENGLWIVQASGSPIRSVDMDNGSSAGGVFLVILYGTVNADTIWICTNDNSVDIVGTNGLSFAQQGNFIGPASSTTNAVVRYANTTGKLGLNSGVIIDNSNNTSGIGTLNTTGLITGGSGLTLTTGNITMAASATVDSVDVSQLKVNFDGVMTTKGDVLVNSGSAVVRLGAGSDNQLLISDSTAPYGIRWQSAAATNTGVIVTVLADHKPTGTQGGTFTSGAWRTRALNQLQDSEGGTTATPSNLGIALDTATNRMIIPVGTYFTICLATSYRVDENRSRLQIMGLAETTKVITVADVSDSLSSKYFDITTTTTSYRIWFNTGASAAPAAGGRTLLMATITTNATANAVATALQTAVNSQTSFYSSLDTNVVTIRNKAVGNVADAVDGNTTFTITKLNDGNTTASTIDISLSTFSKNSAQGTAVATAIITEFTLAFTSVVELQHICATTGTTTGFGLASGLGGLVEQYSTVFFQKIRVT